MLLHSFYKLQKEQDSECERGGGEGVAYVKVLRAMIHRYGLGQNNTEKINATVKAIVQRLLQDGNLKQTGGSKVTSGKVSPLRFSLIGNLHMIFFCILR